MKKAIIFILLSIAVVLTTGSYFFHKSHLKAYKKEFKSFIKKNRSNIPTTKLIINESELYVNTKCLVWVDENKEVYYQGKLYDIVSLIKEKNKNILYLLSDDNEQKLKDEFASIYDNDSFGKTDQKPLKLLKQFLALKYVTPESNVLNSPSLKEIVQPFSEGTFKHQNVFLSQETPPPDFS